MKAVRTPEEAVLAHERAGRHFEAAVGRERLGQMREALDNLVRVPRRDPRYRRAAAYAVRLAAMLGVVDLRFEQFLSDFIASGPADMEEFDTFRTLAGLYSRHGFPENACEALEKILAYAPGLEDVRAELEDLRLRTAELDRRAERVLREDHEFRHGQLGSGRSPADPWALPDLPPLPPPVAESPVTLAGLEVAPAASRPVPRRVPVAAPFAPGVLVAGRYHLEEEIGRGATAAVFRARDLELGEAVALKVYLHAAPDEAAVERFRQELRLSRRLHHPNVARLYDIGVEGGFRFFSMELLVGRTLAEELEGGPLGLERSLRYLLDACAGLQAAHDHGIVHRDVKPGNLFLTREDRLKVMDFGIARQHGTPGMTATGLVIGTPLYIAPEQISDFSSVTAAADLYSLGAVAYHMLAGRPPFDDGESMVLLMRHLNDAPRPLRAHNPAVPAVLEEVVLSLLEKRPERRPQSCRAVAERLSAVVA